MHTYVLTQTLYYTTSLPPHCPRTSTMLPPLYRFYTPTLPLSRPLQLNYSNPASPTPALLRSGGHLCIRPLPHSWDPQCLALPRIRPSHFFVSDIPALSHFCVPSLTALSAPNSIAKFSLRASYIVVVLPCGQLIRTIHVVLVVYVFSSIAMARRPSQFFYD